MARYDAILFDAGETLVSPQPSFGGLLHRSLSELGHERSFEDVDRLGRHALATIMDRELADGRTWSTSAEASEKTWTAIYQTTLAELQIDDSAGVIARELYRRLTDPAHYGLFPDALAALRELKAAGYRLGVISNWEAWLETLLVRLNVMPLLDVCVVSGACGYEKPDARIFKVAIEKLGLEPDRVCYVGDSPSHDVEPALALGMGAVLIDRHDRYPGAHRPTIASLGLISAVL